MPPRAARTVPSIHTMTSSKCTGNSSWSTRKFSSTSWTQTQLRRRMFAWLNGPGEQFRQPVPNSTNYLSSPRSRDDADKSCPFPLNPQYVSESILSEALRNEIWKRVQVDKKSVRQVSVELGVEMRRVGAVVRLVEVEKRMRAEGQLLATPYAKAVHSMVPTTSYDPRGPPQPHESINDLPIHSLTDQQIFYPTSESRAFNRIDAGRVFSGAPRLPDDQDIGQGDRPAAEPWNDTKKELVGKKGHEISVLKAADARIPHSHLIALEQDKRAFVGEQDTIKSRYAQRLRDDARNREIAQAKSIERDEAAKSRIDTSRWQFVVSDASTSREGTGADGRGHKSPGLRYGVPSQDRKRGQVKIPTRVLV